jgi:hypothetical protein
MNIAIRSLLSIALLCAASLPRIGMAADSGHIIKVLGAVSVIRGKEVLNAKVGTNLLTGDVLVTGVDGRVQWQMADESLMVISPNSRFAIEEYQFQGGQGGATARYELRDGGMGTISGLIQSPGYRVDTPAGNISIDGTKYKSIFCKGNCKGVADGLYVLVVDGQVTVSNGGGSLVATTGQTLHTPNQSVAPRLIDGGLSIFLNLSLDFQVELDPNGLKGVIERSNDIVERSLSPS